MNARLASRGGRHGDRNIGRPISREKEERKQTTKTGRKKEIKQTQERIDVRNNKSIDRLRKTEKKGEEIKNKEKTKKEKAEPMLSVYCWLLVKEMSGFWTRQNQNEGHKGTHNDLKYLAFHLLCQNKGNQIALASSVRFQSF